jgi:hypothetical protein
MAEKPVELDTSPEYFGIQIQNLTSFSLESDDLVGGLITTNAVFMGLILLFVTAKIYSKSFVGSKFQIEDCTCIFSGFLK